MTPGIATLPPVRCLPPAGGGGAPVQAASDPCRPGSGNGQAGRQIAGPKANPPKPANPGANPVARGRHVASVSGEARNSCTPGAQGAGKPFPAGHGMPAHQQWPGSGNLPPRLSLPSPLRCNEPPVPVMKPGQASILASAAGSPAIPAVGEAPFPPDFSRPLRSRMAFSISSDMPGFSFRNSRTLSRPWPIRSPL